MHSIVLKPFTPSDFTRFISWVKSESFLYQFAGPVFKYPLTHDQLEYYIKDDSRKVFKVIDSVSKQVIGHCELGLIDERNKKARICRVLVADVENRGKGYGKAIIHALLKIAFGEFNLHRIDLGVFENNIGAIKCYEQCGFHKEGLLRESFLMNGEYHSVYNMSILRREWQNEE